MPKTSLETLTQSYLESWNRQDLASLLDLMHDGVAYYDAFWRETCVGKSDLEQYFSDLFQENRYQYRLLGDIVVVESAVAYRYSAHHRDELEGVETLFDGIEVLTYRDSKIMTVSDFSCPKDPLALAEIARIEQRRHGLSNYVQSGLGGDRSTILANELCTLIAERDPGGPELSAVQIADKLGCSLDHLFQVVECILDPNYSRIGDREKAELASQLLRRGTN